ncbi:MAG: hypothetical protein ACRD0H_25530, partial [Actinomycetes bacterium]
MRSVLGTARRIVLGALVGALLTGCGAGSSQVGAAAFVNDTEIPLEQVHSQLTAVLAKEGPQTREQLVADHQLDDLSRRIVTVAIRHE